MISLNTGDTQNIYKLDFLKLVHLLGGTYHGQQVEIFSYKISRKHYIRGIFK